MMFQLYFHERDLHIFASISEEVHHALIKCERISANADAFLFFVSPLSPPTHSREETCTEPISVTNTEIIS